MPIIKYSLLLLYGIGLTKYSHYKVFALQGITHTGSTFADSTLVDSALVDSTLVDSTLVDSALAGIAANLSARPDMTSKAFPQFVWG